MIGERWLNGGIGGKLRCRAKTQNGDQCTRRAMSFVTTVALCPDHRRKLTREHKPLIYVDVE